MTLATKALRVLEKAALCAAFFCLTYSLCNSVAAAIKKGQVVCGYFI
jgi:hypothetical protein